MGFLWPLLHCSELTSLCIEHHYPLDIPQRDLVEIASLSIELLCLRIMAEGITQLGLRRSGLVNLIHTLTTQNQPRLQLKAFGMGPVCL